MKVLFTTSTMPATDTDPVPAFVKDEAIWLHTLYPKLRISILAPHNGFGNTKDYTQHKHYDEYRFNYFWPRRFQHLTGKGIQPALKRNKWLYAQLPGLFIAETWATWRITRRLKPDVIYAHWFTPQALTSAVVSRLTKTPLVFDTQASDAIVLKHIPFSRIIVAWVCKTATAYTVPSQQTLDKLLYFATDTNKQAILNKVSMIPYGTTPVKVNPSAATKALASYGLENKTILYFIGRLVDRKGVDILIKAYSQLDNRNDKLRLVIVGDGQDRAALEALVKELGIEQQVVFTGFLTGDVRYGLLSQAAVCVIPSINVGDQSEGLPVVFMEATLMGKVTVITDATGAHEVSQNALNTFIVKAGSIDMLVDGIQRALATYESNDEVFVRNVRKLSKSFEWSSVAKRRYQALLEPFTK